MTSSIAIIGAGSWGTALSIVLAPRFERVRLWVREQHLVERMIETRVNDIFVPGRHQPENGEPPAGLRSALEHPQAVAGVMPSRFARALCRGRLEHLRAR